MPDLPLCLGDVLALLERWYPAADAQNWDAVGLVCGDPAEEVSRIHLAVDPVPAVVDEAISVGAQLLVTHHPLLLTGVHGVPADDPKGGLVHRMIRHGVAHFVAHTNADAARPGVNDALAELIGIGQSQPLEPLPVPALDKLVTFVPPDSVAQLSSALLDAGAGKLGDYDSCTFRSDGVGTFRPLAGAHPTVGVVGEQSAVAEVRLEVVLARSLRNQVVAALRREHPYEEPAFDIIEHAVLPSGRGIGRIGDLAEPMTLAQFARLCADRLPVTQWGVRAAGDPQQIVSRVAVCGGSGGSLIEAARHGGADVFLTSDLKHHVVHEAVTERAQSAADQHTPGRHAMALVDAAHWATEAPWLDQLAARLRSELASDDAESAHRTTPTPATTKVSVSRIVTDPWTLHCSS